MSNLLTDRTIIDSIISENLSNALNDYSDMLSNSPTYISYYNKRISSSSQDKTLDNIYTVVGADSPIRFDKIESFPVYSLDQLSLDLSEGEFGEEAEITTTCIILPGTIQPFVDDMLAIPYLDDTVEKIAMFRVIDVKKAIMGSKRFHELEITMVPDEVEEVDAQVDENFIFNTSDYENNKTPILTLNDSIVKERAKNLRRSLYIAYKEMFFEDSASAFMAPLLSGSGMVINYYLHYFIENSKCFEFDRSFLNSSSVLEYSKFTRSHKEIWEYTLYFALLYPDEIENMSATGFSFEPLTVSQASPLAFLNTNIYEAAWMPHTSMDGTTEIFKFSVEEDFFDNIKSNTLYDDELHIEEDIFIKFLNNEYSSDYGELIDDILSLNIFYTLNDFIKFPCYIYMLKFIETQIINIGVRVYDNSIDEVK